MDTTESPVSPGSIGREDWSRRAHARGYIYTVHSREYRSSQRSIRHDVGGRPHTPADRVSQSRGSSVSGRPCNLLDQASTLQSNIYVRRSVTAQYNLPLFLAFSVCITLWKKNSAVCHRIRPSICLSRWLFLGRGGIAILHDFYLVNNFFKKVPNTDFIRCQIYYCNAKCISLCTKFE